MTIEPTTDPVMTMLRAPGTGPRLVALILSGLALVLPGFYTMTDNVDFTTSVLQALPLAFLLPLLVAVALIVSAIASMAQYARLVDLVGAVAGVILSVMIFSTLGQAARAVHESEQMLKAYEPNGIWTASLQVGAFAVFAATIVLAAQVFFGFRRALAPRIGS